MPYVLIALALVTLGGLLLVRGQNAAALFNLRGCHCGLE